MKIAAAIAILLSILAPAVASAHPRRALDIAGPSCAITEGAGDAYVPNFFYLTASGLPPDATVGVNWYWPNPDGWAAGEVDPTDSNGSFIWTPHFPADPGVTNVDILDDTGAIITSCSVFVG